MKGLAQISECGSFVFECRTCHRTWTVIVDPPVPSFPIVSCPEHGPTIVVKYVTLHGNPPWTAGLVYHQQRKAAS
jgi:hypothetical protein